MVPGAGIEPARPLSRKILSLVCLPISPPGHRGGCFGLLVKDRLTLLVRLDIKGLQSM